MHARSDRDNRVTELLKEFAVDGVLPDDVSMVISEFIRCGPWIEAALKHCGGTHKLDDVLEGILRGEFQLWPGVDSVVVTEICEFPRRKVLNYFLAGGDGQELRKMLVDLELFAKSRGCTAVTLTGRKGWLRSFLPKEGYEAQWQVMTKELGHG